MKQLGKDLIKGWDNWTSENLFQARNKKSTLSGDISMKFQMSVLTNTILEPDSRSRKINKKIDSIANI